MNVKFYSIKTLYIKCYCCVCKKTLYSRFYNSLIFIYGFQLSFQEWTQQMKDMLDARKRGDQAFREKDFKTAIDCYSQVPNVVDLHIVRTCLVYISLLLDSLSTLEQWCHQLCLDGEVYATYCAINQTQHYATRCKRNACILTGQRLSTCSLWR